MTECVLHLVALHPRPMVAAFHYNCGVAQTIGYHWVKSCYGQWLPGDDRGSWSEAWDEQLGFVEPHMLHEGDPVRQRMAEERMNHPVLRMSPEMTEIVANTIGECVRRSNGGLSVAAIAIEPTHMHVLIPYSGRDIHTTVKWLADQTAKAVHRQTDHKSPVWSKGKWCSYVFDAEYWRNLRSYICRHNLRAGHAADPFSFVTATEVIV